MGLIQPWLVPACIAVLLLMLAIRYVPTWVVVERRPFTDGGKQKLLTMHICQTVRFVSMDGCMAHVRGKVDEGKIVGFVGRRLYGSEHRTTRMAQVRLSDGRLREWAAEPSEWWPNEVDGVLEHRM